MNSQPQAGDEEMSSDWISNPPLTGDNVDEHWLDFCECGERQHHQKRPTKPEDYEPKGLLVCTWSCPECGVTDHRFEDEDGSRYDCDGKLLP